MQGPISDSTVGHLLHLLLALLTSSNRTQKERRRMTWSRFDQTRTVSTVHYMYTCIYTHRNSGNLKY